MMRASRFFVLLLVTLALGGCVAQIPAETRSRLNTIAVVSLLGSEVRHTDREWWQEPYVEEVCSYETRRNQRYRRCWLETRFRTVSRILGVHVAALTGLDVDAAAAALLGARVAQSGARLRVLPGRFGEVPAGAVTVPPAEPGQLPPAMAGRLREAAQESGADAVLVLQGECAGPAGGCWAASVERTRPAGIPYAVFTPWAPSSRFHAWLFDPAKGTIVARWSAPELKLVRAGWQEQPPPPALPGAVAGALDPAAAQLAAQSIRFGIAELADDFICALQGSGACQSILATR